MNQPVDDRRTEQTYPISVVAAVTGINPVTLRAWERRYGLIKPQRTEKGHRLYTQDNIDAIHRIKIQLEHGIPISQVKLNSNNGESLQTTEHNPDEYWQTYIDRMVIAIENYNEAQLESTYNQLISLYPIDIVTSRLLIPLLKLLGQQWANKPAGIAEEHFFSTYMRNKLGARFHHRKKYETGPTLLLACVPGEAHEFGMLLFALAAHDHGYRIVMLGADLPLKQIPLVTNKISVDAIVLSSSLALEANECEELAALANAVAVPVLLGGDTATQQYALLESINVTPLSDSLNESLSILTGKLNQKRI